MPFAAAIFDLDGTLIDTERLVIEAGAETFAALGHDVDHAFLVSLIGVAEAEGRRRLAARFGGVIDLASAHRHWDRAIRARYDAGIPVKPGVIEVLGGLTHLPLAVATNSRTDNARRKLAQTGLLQHFDHVVGFDVVAQPKPAPDVFLEAARRIDAQPGQCVVFEDSETGVAAALAAGMTVVHVPDLHAPETTDAHHLAATLHEGAQAVRLL